MKKLSFLHTCSFLVLLLAATFSIINCMDEVFAPTGKKYSDDQWQLLGDPEQEVLDKLRKQYRDPSITKVSTAMMQGDVKKLNELFNQKTHSIDQPSILSGTTTRSGLRFYYPLEHAINFRAPIETINELIRLGAPVKQYKGYDPLLHIFSVYYSEPKIDSPDLLNLADQYATTLVKHGANPHEKPLYTRRTYDQKYFGGSDSPILAIKTLISGLQNDLVNLGPTRNIEKWQTITKDAISRLEARIIEWQNLPSSSTVGKITGQPSTVIGQPQSLAASIGSQNGSMPNLPARQSQLSLSDTVSRWCKNNKPGSAKTGICIVALALTAVASRVLYKTLFKRHTTPPAQITIINDTDTSITLAYKTNTSTDITSITLRPKENWLLDINKIKLDILVTQLETVEAPLHINLSKYKASENQKNKSLQITILKSSPIRYLLFKIAYTYSVEWQPNSN